MIAGYVPWRKSAARVWLDAAPGKFAAGKMYRFKEDEETGVRVLTRYRVVWN
jgi:hypothetical protein